MSTEIVTWPYPVIHEKKKKIQNQIIPYINAAKTLVTLCVKKFQGGFSS